jgi:hypothetical protein
VHSQWYVPCRGMARVPQDLTLLVDGWHAPLGESSRSGGVRCALVGRNRNGAPAAIAPLYMICHVIRDSPT